MQENLGNKHFRSSFTSVKIIYYYESDIHYLTNSWICFFSLMKIMIVLEQLLIYFTKLPRMYKFDLWLKKIVIRLGVKQFRQLFCVTLQRTLTSKKLLNNSDVWWITVKRIFKQTQISPLSNKHTPWST